MKNMKHDMSNATKPSNIKSFLKGLYRIRGRFAVVALTLLVAFTLAACGDLDLSFTDRTRPADPDLPTPFTDTLALTADYHGKSFIEDGIGEVNLHLCIDGDTTHFTQVHGADQRWFSLRYLAVDTPESTGRIEPWGFKASAFVCDILENADIIVLEADPNRERLDSTGNRYLGYVWADGRLVNLEVVEQAYSHATGVHELKYGNELFDAWVATQATGRRIHGEQDPDFDYDIAYDPTVAVHIMDLVLHPERYIGFFITVQGVITRVEGAHPWLEQDGYGIYLYRGFEYTTYLQPGNEVRLSNLQLTYFPDPETGARQLTNFRRRNMEVISTPNRGIVFGIQAETGFQDALLQTNFKVDALTRLEFEVATWRDEAETNFNFLDAFKVQISADKENWTTVEDVKLSIDTGFNATTRIVVDIDTQAEVYVRLLAVSADGLLGPERLRLLIKNLELFTGPNDSEGQPAYNFDFGALGTSAIYETELTTSHVVNRTTGNEMFNALERLHANISTSIPVMPRVLTIDDIKNDNIDRYVGSLITLENVEIIRLLHRLNPDYDPNDPASQMFIPNTFDDAQWTMVVEDAFGNRIDIRKNDRTAFRFCHIDEPENCTPGATPLEEGMIINITGPITIWDGDKQLVLTRVTDLVVQEED